ncbi:putative NAD(P)H quinone oxidoreductase, PIG3 family [Lentibacillus persicus]|uniref:Putative NAD(P)H quinone oxidoreductase, PIG3 family n=1 Tax=Lentibacillus persicus TaxID=640948 RepID=A0A1I1RZA3_9BACI|nr:NAD(P)H-quinone oxidoreductase [Lentibacillus persicus]SFD39659.1 putative NAD(P)H quinone oxidoreductase, PIG3 family [Lentibacillus persicus]
MKGILVKEGEKRNTLELTDMPNPDIGAGDLLVRVDHAAVNRTDILNREGKSGYAANPILGVEAAGIVVDPNGHESFSDGDRVMGLVNGGGYAEYVPMPADRAMKIPSALSFADAAAIPEVFLTAYQTLYWIGKLQKHETVLIHAGASGVGTAAIQMANQLSEAQVIVTAGSARKLTFCQEIGADVVVNYKEQAFDEEVLKATANEGVDLILDFIGADYWDKNFKSIKKGGRWVLIGMLGGAELKNFNLMTLMSKYIQLTGTLLTPRSDVYKAELSNEFTQAVMPYMEEGKIRPIVDTVFPIEKANEAHEHMENNRNIGKILLNMNRQ